MELELDLPDGLVEAMKMRTVEENCSLPDLMTESIRCGMDNHPAEPGAIRNRVRLPFVHGAQSAETSEELTPERVADILLAQEAEAHNDLLR